MPPLTIPMAQQQDANAGRAGFRMQTRRRQGQEGREVGLSLASAKSLRKEYTPETGSNKNIRETKENLAASQAYDAFNVEGLGKKIDHVNFFHVIAGFQKQPSIAR